MKKLKEFFTTNKIKELNESSSGLLKFDKQNINKIDFNIDKKTSKKINNIINPDEDHKYHKGHRARLKEKILNTNIEQLKDYELLEALLTFSIPRSDVKPLAKKLLEIFKNFNNLLKSNHSKLKLKGIGASTQYFFKIINETCARMAKEEINDEISLDNAQKVICYCRIRMSHLEFEQFRVLFLNRKNKLILDEVMQSGTIDKAAIFPREIVKRAIDVGAGAIILVHNHPSGDPTPSKADIEVTETIQKAASLMEIYLYDHIIIGKTSHYSMKINDIMVK